MPSSPRRAGDVGEGQTGNVRTLSANIKKKGIFPVVLNRTVGLGKGKKGNYPRLQDKPQFLRFILKRLVKEQTVF